MVFELALNTFRRKASLGEEGKAGLQLRAKETPGVCVCDSDSMLFYGLPAMR